MSYVAESTSPAMSGTSNVVSLAAGALVLVGAGLLAERPGAGTAGPALAGPLALAWRVSRGALLL